MSLQCPRAGTFDVDCCGIMSFDIGCKAFVCQGPFRAWLIKETITIFIVVLAWFVIESLAYLRLRTRILMCKY